MQFTKEDFIQLSQQYKEAWIFLNNLRLVREAKEKDALIADLQKKE